MRPLRGERLLEAWEAGAAQTSLTRPLALLAAASDDERSWDELMELSIAERDLELLRLRQATLGEHLRGCLPCACCATRLEFDVPVQSMIDRFEALRLAGPGEFVLRPVTSRDLKLALGSSDPRRHLLSLCGTAAALTAGAEQVDAEFERINEGAETRFMLPCPECGEAGPVEVDIGGFLWTEVRHAALTMLREVHELASAYGWPERTILDMSAARRLAYLEMART